MYKNIVTKIFELFEAFISNLHVDVRRTWLRLKHRFAWLLVESRKNETQIVNGS